jgi:hypothetical protein
MQECLSDDAEFVGVVFAHDQAEVAGVGSVACSDSVVQRDEDVSGEGIGIDDCGDVVFDEDGFVIFRDCFLSEVVEVCPASITGSGLPNAISFTCRSRLRRSRSEESVAPLEGPNDTATRAAQPKIRLIACTYKHFSCKLLWSIHKASIQKCWIPRNGG